MLKVWLCIPFVFLLGPFDVTITASGISTAGEEYTLTCSVDVPGTPSIQWQYSNGSVVTSGDGITVSAGVLTFNPLRTSHGGQYPCQATAGMTGVVRSAMWDFTVQSKCDLMYICVPHLTLHTL